MKKSKEKTILSILLLTFLAGGALSQVREFERNPVSFLQKNVVTTWYPAALTQGSGVRSLSSGSRYEFGLSPVSDNTAYSLYPLGSGKDGITAYWLSTSGSLEIPAYSGPSIIFTPELNGCSLYVRYNEAKKTISVFHHLRVFGNSGPGEKSLTEDKNLGQWIVGRGGGRTEAYDDVLAWEEYGADRLQQSLAEAANKAVVSGHLPQGTVAHLRGTHATSFLYRAPGGEWNFVYQKFRHNAQTGSNPEPNAFKLDSVQMRRVCGVPDQVQKPAPAATPPSRKNSIKGRGKRGWWNGGYQIPHGVRYSGIGY